MWPLSGRMAWGIFQRHFVEGRNPKAERSPKTEEDPKQFDSSDSDFEIRTSFGLRPSDFGLGFWPPSHFRNILKSARVFPPKRGGFYPLTGCGLRGDGEPSRM